MATRERDVDATPGTGLRFKRYFTKDDVHPFDEVEWEIRDAVIPNFKEGETTSPDTTTKTTAAMYRNSR